MTAQFSRLQNRLIVAFVLLLLIPALIATVYNALRTSEVLLQAEARSQSERASAQAAEVADSLIAVNTDLLFISQQPAIRRYVNTADAAAQTTLLTEVERFFEGYLERANGRYQGACLLSAAGMEQVCVDVVDDQAVVRPVTQLASRVREPYFSRVVSLTSLPGRQAPVYVGALRLLDAAGVTVQPFEPTIPHSTLLLTDLGTIAGVLAVQVRAQPLFDLIVPESDSQTVRLVDADGNYLLHPDESRRFGQFLSSGFSLMTDAPTDAQALLTQSDGVLFGSADDPTALQVFQRIRPQGQASIQWTAIYSEPLSVVFQPITQTTLVSIGITLLAVLIAVGVAIVITRGITQPVSQLAEAARSISQGQWQTPLPVVRSKDEISTLVSAFSTMVTDLQVRTDALLTANRLEKEQREKLDAALHHQQHLNEEMERINHELERAVHISEEATRLKSEFVANMSHELRTPLNAIRGFCGIMLEGMSGEIDDDARHMLRRIDLNSERLLTLINDILDIAKIEAGRMEVMREPIFVRALADAWRTQMSVLAEKKRLDFSVVIDPALPEKLIGDAGLITQVVSNLLSNAFKFTSEGSVTLELTRDESNWILAVSDTGIGIPPHALNFIFEEFRQVDGSSRREYGGTGLGLAIVRNICRLMNGSIAVKSTMHVGSTFTVTLPLQAEPGALNAPAAAAPTPQVA